MDEPPQGQAPAPASAQAQAPETASEDDTDSNIEEILVENSILESTSYSPVFFLFLNFKLISF